MRQRAHTGGPHAEVILGASSRKASSRPEEIPVSEILLSVVAEALAAALVALLVTAVKRLAAVRA